MEEPNRPFYLASKPQLRQYAQKSAENRRTPELKKAWQDQETIRQRCASGEWASDLAKEYGIKVRQVYRILKGNE
jgi:hypothetical protein